MFVKLLGALLNLALLIIYMVYTGHLSGKKGRKRNICLAPRPCVFFGSWNKTSFLFFFSPASNLL